MTDSERPVWIVLLATGNPAVTHTEWIHSLAGLNEFMAYYAGRDMLVFPPEEAATLVAS